MAESQNWDAQDPGGVPDEFLDIGTGFDTDSNGMPDTAVTVDGIDLVVAIDLDGDGFADQVLRIGPDAVVREVGPEKSGSDGLLDPVEPGDQ
jgi:hypothetical protein